MKFKIFILIFSILFIIGFGIIESIFMDNTFEYLENELNEFNYEDEINMADLQELTEWWDKKLNIMHFFIPHIHLEEITKGLGELTGAVLTDDKEAEKELIYRLLATSSSLSEMYKIKLGNIF